MSQPVFNYKHTHTHCTEKSSFWGERRDYWHYLSEGVGELKGLDSIVKIVQAQQQVRERGELDDHFRWGIKFIFVIVFRFVHVYILVQWVWSCYPIVSDCWCLQVTTGLGRGRALIRRCLCEGLLADCIQNAVSNTKRTKWDLKDPIQY